MAAKHDNLVSLMISHMQTVMRLQATYGGMPWLYDWRSGREMNAEGGIMAEMRPMATAYQRMTTL